MKLKSTCSKATLGRRINVASIAVLMAGVVAVSSASAASLNNIIEVEQKKLKVAQASQDKVDKLSEERRKLYNQYKAVNKEIEGLVIYNKQVNKQLVNQRKEMERIRQSMEDAQVTQRQVVPLMLRMIEGLKQFRALDIPFLEKERQERINDLEEYMDDANISVAEKFRIVITAYQREMEYGYTIESYSATLPIDGVDQNVRILRFGRVALVYQTQDGKQSGYWDQGAGAWVAANGGTDRKNISMGLKVADKQAMDLVILPVKAPEAAQ